MQFIKDTFEIIRAKFNNLTKHQKMVVVAVAVVLGLLIIS